MNVARLALVTLLIAGCAVRPARPPAGAPPDWDARRVMLQDLGSWEARGRIAVKSGDDGGQGSIRWAQSASMASIRLSGPLGAGGYEIEWSDRKVAVTRADGTVEAAWVGPDAAIEFLNAQLGWSFPAASLRYWLLGVPHPRYESLERFDQNGWLTAVEQNGWSVKFEKFRREGGAWLPGKVVINGENARLRLVVDAWML